MSQKAKTWCSCQKVQISLNSKKSDTLTMLGFLRTKSWNIIRNGVWQTAHYSEMLHDKLKLVIQNKYQGQLSQGIMLLHDNTCPCTAAHTVQTLQQLHFEVLEHTLYSPDLVLSDCHLFGPLKNAFRSCHFSICIIYTYLCVSVKTLYCLYYCVFAITLFHNVPQHTKFKIS
jgi:hypothetical protein